MMEQALNFIGGKAVPALSGGWLDDVNPATGEVWCRVPDSGAEDVDRAVAAAEAAFPSWSATPAEERCRFLLRIADLIDRDLDRLALAETTDTGKPLGLSRSMDIPRAAKNFRFFATAILHWSSESHVEGERTLNYTLREPVGVAGCISPWNLPLYLLTWKIAPALAAGNCVVAKPSELTPMTAHLLAGIAAEAGLPSGVLNIVHGTGARAGASLVGHPRVPAISFTGGTATGREIARTASPMFKKISLELGGKNPLILFGDCRYDEMLPTAARSAFTNQGQICLSSSRIFVERSMAQRFTEDFVTAAKTLRVGDPLAAESNLGAVISAAHRDKILAHVAQARKDGGKILCGGRAVAVEGRCRGGWFVEPTVITGLAPECRSNQEEIFGPVATVIPFDREEEVLAYANGTPYGLSASIWTENLTRAHRLAGALKSGIVWINCWLVRDLRTPFGGTKSSGVGREGGWEALRFFTEPKNVCLKLKS